MAASIGSCFPLVSPGCSWVPSPASQALEECQSQSPSEVLVRIASSLNQISEAPADVVGSSLSRPPLSLCFDHSLVSSMPFASFH